MKITNLLTNKITLIVCSFLIVSQAFSSSKESTTYIGTNGKITTADQATEMLVIRTKSTKKISIQTYIKKKKEWDKTTTDNYKLMNDSTYRIKENSAKFTGTIHRIFTRQNDKLYRFKDVIKEQTMREGTASSVVPLLLQGEVTEYYKNGRTKSISQYNNNELLSNKNWNSDGSKYFDDLFYSVDVYPTFKPGAEVINKRLMNAFKTAGIDISSISGSLVIGFVITKKGKIAGVKVLKGILPTVNMVASDTFVNMKGEWTPAKLNGKVVQFFQVFPINFIYRQQTLEFAELRGNTLHWGAY